MKKDLLVKSELNGQFTVFKGQPRLPGRKMVSCRLEKESQAKRNSYKIATRGVRSDMRGLRTGDAVWFFRRHRGVEGSSEVWAGGLN